MNSKQIIAIGLAIAATVGIYFGTTNVKPSKKAVADTHQHDEHDGHDHADHDHEHAAPAAPMMAGAMMSKPADFDSLVTDIKRRLLSPQVRAEIENIEHQTVTESDKAVKFKAYESLGKRWQAIGQKGIAAHYFAKAGDLENSEKILNFAGHLYEEGMSGTNDPAIRQLFADGRVATLNKIVSLNPSNDSLTMEISMAMIDQGDVMNGVLKLREYAEKNPTNIKAQVTLGKLALQSNQIDKAIERGNLILGMDAENFETHLFLGEAYKQKGDNAKAIQLFNKAKEILNNPEFTKEMDAYIATFKK